MQIISGQETFAAVQSMAEDLIEYYQLDQTQTEQAAEITTEGLSESTVPASEPTVSTSESAVPIDESTAPPSESTEPSNETPRLFQKP